MTLFCSGWGPAPKDVTPCFCRAFSIMIFCSGSKEVYSSATRRISVTWCNSPKMFTPFVLNEYGFCSTTVEKSASKRLKSVAKLLIWKYVSNLTGPLFSGVCLDAFPLSALKRSICVWSSKPKPVLSLGYFQRTPTRAKNAARIIFVSNLHGR